MLGYKQKEIGAELMVAGQKINGIAYTLPGIGFSEDQYPDMGQIQSARSGT
ncbi:hypothetical protein D3C80_1816770 [compost metagenome]